MNARVLVFGGRSGDRYRAGRSLRGLRAPGVTPEDVCGLDARALAEKLAATTEPVWLVRAGAWPVHEHDLVFPPPSATGRPLCALGLVRPEVGAVVPSDSASRRWAAFHAETGGDFSRAANLSDRLPDVASVYLEPSSVSALVPRLSRGVELSQAIQAEFGTARFRVVHFAPLDVHYDSALRVVQLVTSIQQGGAERITLELAEQLGRCGVRCRVVTICNPTRQAFAAPDDTVDLARFCGDREARADAVARVATSFGADIVHGHLIDGADSARLAARGLPLVLTVHNMRPGWPEGLESLDANDARLLVACAQAVEAELRAAGTRVPVRTIWNGVDFAACARTAARVAAGRELRAQLGFAPDDFVLLALANPRPQKRLHLLPAILAATRAEFARRGSKREARLVFAGQVSRGNQTAALAVENTQDEIARLGLGEHVRWTGSIDRVAVLLAAVDVLVSTSAYEGLSLAQLEALAAGVPVVATDVGGAAEVARDNPCVFPVPHDADPDRVALTIADIARQPPVGGREAAIVHFDQSIMTERYCWLYPRAIEAARGRHHGRGLFLVTNNFSTGGAQSSARRLLIGLAAEGIRVRAAVLEEEADNPTPGRRALGSADIPVIALPPAGTYDATAAVATLLEAIAEFAPDAVLFWNAIAPYKILLADGLLDVPVYDVSPGEMYFASLERYFARPRPGLPYRTAADYGARLAGVIVKFQAEAARAAETLGTAVHVIPNGVPVDGSRIRPRAVGGRFVIGTAARINPQKKLEELLAALARAHRNLPPYVLRIAGGVERDCDDYAASLQRQAEGLSVEWLGDVQDSRSFLQGLDLFTLIAEPAGCPNASLEAMAAGLPVVATDVGGIAEQVEDRVTGRLIARGDIDGLAAAFVELARDPVLCARWGEESRNRIASRFSLDRMVANYRRVCLGEQAMRVESRG